MALLARGSVTDRPWGLTFGALGVRGLSGELSVDADGKNYRVAFYQGAVVAAWSPLASDAAVRLALTGNLVTSTQVADITRRMATTPDRDEVDLLAELARLGPEQAMKLRRRLIAQRAARAGSLERGEFTVDDEYTLGYVPGSELDIRAISYLAAKNNLSEERMLDELTRLGGWYKLKEEAVEDLGQYGFTETEKPILQQLLGGADLLEAERAHASLGARAVRAVTYALVSCGACEIRQSTARAVAAPGRGNAPPGQPAGRRGTPPPVTARTATPQAPVAARPPGPSRPPATAMPSASGAIPKVAVQPNSGATARARTPSMAPDVTEGGPVRMGTPTGQPPMQTTPLHEARAARVAPASPRRAKSSTAATTEIEQLLAHKIPLLDARADHFTLLGLSTTASADEIRQTYFMLARKLHPDRLSAIGVDDNARNAQRLMAQLNAAFAVLNDPAKRAEYVALQARGGEAAVRAEQSQADEMAMRVMRAEEAFRQGEMALRRDQLPQAIAAFQTAVELQPNESEYTALLAWAQFAAAPDKTALAGGTRKALQRAIEKNERSPTARFYLGRVERMLGKEREALALFQEVLRLKPNHAEASSEARLLEQRLKGKR